MKQGWIAGILVICAVVGGEGAVSAEAAPANVDHARIVEVDREPGEWMSHGRTYSEQRFSPLNDIDVDNVEGLGLAWAFDFPDKRGLEATPIVVDGVMYVSGAWSRVFAIDANSGRERWRYDPAVPGQTARVACCDVVNRGVAVWKGRVYVGTLDGRLIALDARDGSVAWEVLTIDRSLPYTITGAPRIVKGRVLIGNGGAEYGVRGYLSAYDAETGALVWRFHTVPGNPAEGYESEAMRMAAETWSGEWWRLGGGGTVWDSLAYDPELDLLYVGVGNGSPWNRRLRSPGGGDNLFLSSIVALRPETGSYVWHYQVVPAETWDYTATQHMILADIEWEGRVRKVLMQAPKSGFFMIIDRETGEFLSAEPFAEVTWASHYDKATGRPVEVKGQDYAGGSAAVKPTSGGAHNWQPMAYHPGTGLVYLPVMEALFTFEDVDVIEIEPGLRNRGIMDAADPPGDAQFYSRLQRQLVSAHLLAWDPRKQQEAWRAPQAVGWNGGLLATAGNLVFQGGGDGFFRARRADDGDLLWSFPAQTGVIATPITYSVDGVQYVSVLAGWGGSFGLMSGISMPPGPPNGRVLTFRIGGGAELPRVPDPPNIPDPPMPLDVPAQEIARGGALYAKYCAFCHGTGVVSGGTVPDLRRLPTDFHRNFDAIVRLGAMRDYGMPSFGDVLDKGDVQAIHAFVIDEAVADAEYRNRPSWWNAVLDFFYDLVVRVMMFFVAPSVHSA